MNSSDSLVLGEEGCSFKDIVGVFFNEANSATVLNIWKDFARELRIKSFQIEKWRLGILHDKITEKDVLYKILESWKSEKGKDASLPLLLTHLENIKLKNVTADLKKLKMENWLLKDGTSFRPTLPKQSKYYIPRTLTRRVISAKVFASTHRDIFVIYGIKLNRLSQLSANELTDTSSNQVGKDELSVRFVLLENLGDWALLCDKTTNPIHLLRHREGKFLWICTKGDISALQKASDEKIQTEMTEEELIEEIENCHQFQTNQPICLSDSPGMGKSLLLANIGRQLQQRYPERIIVFIVISEFVIQVRNKLPKFDNTEKAALEALLRLLCENNSTRKHLLQRITTPTDDPSTHVELMFDGFDEVSTENFYLARECLEIFKTDFKSAIRVWVTTRPQHLQEIEKRFSVLGHKIQPFQEKHQIDFLVSYWTNERKNMNRDKLQKFSKKCLNTLKERLNKKDEDIAGIPLQCMMIAEVYSNEAHRFCHSINPRLDNFPVAAPSIDVNSISELYEKMIKFKIEKFIRTYPLQPDEIRKMWSLHMYLALQLIFPTHVHQFNDNLKIEFDSLSLDYLVNIGIFEHSGNTAKDPMRFIHRTFAEYLAARYFVSYAKAHSTADVQNPSKKLPNFLFENVLECSVKKLGLFGSTYYKCSFKHPVLCHFMDALLGSETNISSENIVGLKSIMYMKDVLYSCIHSDFGNIFKLLHCSLKRPYRFFINYICYSDSKILVDATGIVSLDFFKFLQQNVKHLPSLVKAVRRGSYSIFEYILEQHNFEDLVKQDKELLRLVYWTVKNTLDCDLGEIQDRIQIVTALSGLNRGMINYWDGWSQAPPLLAPKVNLLLLKTLIECQANLLQCDRYKNTILHTATEYLSPIYYYELLQFIPKTTLISLLKMRNKNGETSLHLILKHDLGNPDILNLILSNGVDVNTIDITGFSYIFYGLESKIGDMIIPTVKFLLEKCADHTHVLPNGDSILHYAAQEGRIDCLQFFLEEKNMNVNQSNKFGNTPIFSALHNCSLGSKKTVQFLLERGAKYNVLNSSGDNVLHYAALHSQPECMQLFLSLGGIDINLADKDGDTPLLCALSMYEANTVEIIRLLLGNGADHTITNKERNNVLHLLARIGSVECFSEFAGLSSLDVNARNFDNDTPLHLLVKNINKYAGRYDDLNSFFHTIEALLLLGADINAKNDDGKTPLAIYQQERWKLRTFNLGIHVTIRILLQGKFRRRNILVNN